MSPATGEKFYLIPLFILISRKCCAIAKDRGGTFASARAENPTQNRPTFTRGKFTAVAVSRSAPIARYQHAYIYIRLPIARQLAGKIEREANWSKSRGEGEGEGAEKQSSRNLLKRIKVRCLYGGRGLPRRRYVPAKPA